MVKFSSKIYKIGINPVVDPPENVLRAIFEQAEKDKGPIPVRGRLNGADFIQTLVKYHGVWRLYINGPMLKDSSLGVGDMAKVKIEFDSRSREVPMLREFAAALAKDNAAKKEFDKLPPSRQKEILRYLSNLKSKESVAKNVERILRHLNGKPTDAQHALMRRKK